MTTLSETETTPTTLRPDSPAQLAEAVQWALAANEPLEIVGGGSRRALGRPVRTAHRLDLSGLSGVTAYEPEELVLTAGAGTPMAVILPLLAEKRQRLAFEPPDYGPLLGKPAGLGSFGGLVACGLAGPRRIKDGGMRDHILGTRGVNGRGELYRAGAAVVKNVTGYDLPKLMAGSFGTLTALSEVTVKVLPAPEETRTLLLAGRDEAAGIAALTRAMRSPYEVSGAAHLPAGIAARSAVGRVSGAGGSVTLVRLEGFAPSVAARAAALTEELGTDALLDRADSLALWREIGDAAYFAAGPDELGQGRPDLRGRHVWKLSVPPQDGPAVAAALRRSLEAELWFDWAGGLLWVAVTPAEGEAERIRAAMPGTGHATLVRAPEAVRGATAVFQPLPEPLMALTRRVKSGFDPRGLFNPGRLYDGL